MSKDNSNQTSGLRIKRESASVDFGNTPWHYEISTAMSGVLTTDLTSISRLTQNINNMGVSAGEPFFAKLSVSGNSYVKYSLHQDDGTLPTVTATGHIMAFGLLREDGTGPT